TLHANPLPQNELQQKYPIGTPVSIQEDGGRDGHLGQDNRALANPLASSYSRIMKACGLRTTHQPTDRRFFSSDLRTFPDRMGQLLHVHAFAVRAPTLVAEVRGITRLVAHLGEFGRIELLIAP